MRKIALSLVLCMLFGLCACSSQPEDLNKSSNPQEAETSQETESSEEFDPDFMLDMQTLELIMPDGEENRIHQIDVADSTNFYLREENGEESLYECHVSSETFYMIDNSTGTYFEGTYSVSENTITVSVTDYDYGVQPVDIAWQEKTYTHARFTLVDKNGQVVEVRDAQPRREEFSGEIMFTWNGEAWFLTNAERSSNRINDRQDELELVDAALIRVNACEVVTE